MHDTTPNHESGCHSLQEFIPENWADIPHVCQLPTHAPSRRGQRFREDHASTSPTEHVYNRSEITLSTLTVQWPSSGVVDVRTPLSCHLQATCPMWSSRLPSAFGAHDPWVGEHVRCFCSCFNLFTTALSALQRTYASLTIFCLGQLKRPSSGLIESCPAGPSIAVPHTPAFILHSWSSLRGSAKC